MIMMGSISALLFLKDFFFLFLSCPPPPSRRYAVFSSSTDLSYYYYTIHTTERDAGMHVRETGGERIGRTRSGASTSTELVPPLFPSRPSREENQNFVLQEFDSPFFPSVFSCSVAALKARQEKD